MEDVKVNLVKGFSNNKDGGNPAGVVLSQDISTEEMQHVAAEIDFSVTAFVEKENRNAFSVRFFTPTEEDEVCGHGTIAVFHLLSEKGMLKYKSGKATATQETKAGKLEIECYRDGKVVMEQKKPRFLEHKEDSTVIAKLLGIESDNILNYPIQIISTGKPKMIVPVDSLETLLNVEPDYEGIVEMCERTGAKGIYPFTFDTREDGDVHARQFNPLQGIYEDPLTGTAAGPLGVYLKNHSLTEKDELVVEQGYSMEKPGKIYVDISSKCPKVGGHATIYGEKEVELD
ncbi:PhzF family phenazine biosynthesis protein [Candidatus Nanohalococcus occultus]|uniref:PhzF family phenazine biosynthesis protein n=1 Tax=Candidatus Nanohalococcus occultus TaxID=2978047 RepID=UPI0039E17C3F